MIDIAALNRIELADLQQPERIAHKVHDLLGPIDGPIPVVQIAGALDVSEVKLDLFDGFEGMLLTDDRRSKGVIVANTRGGRKRARYTVAHELGHFLMERHVPSTEAGFRCTTADLKERRQANRHFRQEAEANRFAIELLAPQYAYDQYLGAAPDLEAVRTLSKALDLSKEATARRYRDLHEGRIAMVFHRNRAVRYVDRPDEFPAPSVVKHSALPTSVEVGLAPGTLTDLEIADPKDWFDGPPMAELSVQTLYQNKGFGITMLALEDEVPDNGGPEDTCDRYSRFG